MTVSTILRFWAEILGTSEDMISPRAKLDKQNGADATSLAKLVIRCERAFGITIFDEDVLAFGCLTDLADYIDERLKDGRDDYAPVTDQSRTAWYYE